MKLHITIFAQCLFLFTYAQNESYITFEHCTCKYLADQPISCRFKVKDTIYVDSIYIEKGYYPNGQIAYEKPELHAYDYEPPFDAIFGVPGFEGFTSGSYYHYDLSGELDFEIHLAPYLVNSGMVRRDGKEVFSYFVDENNNPTGRWKFETDSLSGFIDFDKNKSKLIQNSVGKIESEIKDNKLVLNYNDKIYTFDVRKARFFFMLLGLDMEGLEVEGGLRF